MDQNCSRSFSRDFLKNGILKFFRDINFSFDEILRCILTYKKIEIVWKSWKTKIMSIVMELENDSRVLSFDEKFISHILKNNTWTTLYRLIDRIQVFEETWDRIVNNLLQNVTFSVTTKFEKLFFDKFFEFKFSEKNNFNPITIS